MKERNEGQLEGRTVEDGDDRGDVIEKEWNVEGRDFHRILPRGGGERERPFLSASKTNVLRNSTPEIALSLFLSKFLSIIFHFSFELGGRKGRLWETGHKGFILHPLKPHTIVVEVIIFQNTISIFVHSLE
jgi:hypothetical protein